MRIDKLKEMPHWSYSAMQCYLTCPLKYKFRYIDNAEPERTGSCFPFGRAFHAALSERARIGKDMSEREVCDVFEDYFKAEIDAAENLIYKPNEDYDSMLQTGFKMVEVACNNWQDDFAVQRVAETFSVNIPGLSKPLIGEFDCVVTDGHDNCIVDWKTASAKWPVGKADKDLQATAFSYAFKEKYGENRCSVSTFSQKPRHRPSTTITHCGQTMSLTVLFRLPTVSKRASTAVTSIPMKAASGVASARTVTVVRNGDEYGIDDV